MRTTGDHPSRVAQDHGHRHAARAARMQLGQAIGAGRLVVQIVAPIDSSSDRFKPWTWVTISNWGRATCTGTAASIVFLKPDRNCTSNSFL